MAILYELWNTKLRQWSVWWYVDRDSNGRGGGCCTSSIQHISSGCD